MGDPWLIWQARRKHGRYPRRKKTPSKRFRPYPHYLTMGAAILLPVVILLALCPLLVIA